MIPHGYHFDRCLIVTRSLPWPAVGGGRLRDWQNVSILSSLVNEIAVVALEGPMSEPPRASLAKPPLLWVTLDRAVAAEPIPFDGSEQLLVSDWWRNANGHWFDSAWSPFRASALKRILTRHHFDFAVLEDATLWRYADIVSRFCPVIVDWHNIQSHLERRYLDFIPLPNGEERRRQEVAVSTMVSVEKRYRRGPVVVCSEHERSMLIADGFEPPAVSVIHNTLNWPYHGADCGAEDPVPARRDVVVLFAGVLNYFPNISAVLTLMNEIFPKVRECLPEARLSIVGTSPTMEILEAARQQPGVFVTGEVLDIEPFFREATVLCVPLEMGSGTRFKILEAFRYGVPVVASEKAFEGLNVIVGSHLLAARSPAEHVGCILELVRQPHKRASLVNAGRQLLRAQYSIDTAARQWRESLARWFGPRAIQVATQDSGARQAFAGGLGRLGPGTA